ncbi:MAG: DUF2478 domain-containing protein [Rhodospirillaceae bacterium]|jgi:hypothetical protein|nr:DUF2478 domain-containing protein [Rhodospirillaceae bacterium]MBT6510925.1 DUF2478 domain-containing protein [Rhodospirillaceae bacterium]MBT7612474.1 DUF2478 domain-containing protein [Rhodospirillaceae bacterium]
MQTSSGINEQAIFLDTWLKTRDFFERLCDYNHAFRELRAVLNNEQVAGSLSLADVASMVNCPVADLVAIANGEDIQASPTLPLNYAGGDGAPDEVDSNETTTGYLDTRPIFDRGQEPLAEILKLLKSSPPESHLVIDAPFHPAPLRRLMQQRGYVSHARQISGEHWRCTFVPGVAPFRIAAIVSDGTATTGAILTGIADTLREEGFSLAGAVQDPESAEQQANVEHGMCDMDLLVLPDGKRFTITQNLGTQATSCRLDHQALEDVVALVDQRLDASTDLLILNKFGKREAEGAGFRQTIGHAIELGVPVIVAVNPAQRGALSDFAGDDLEYLPENLNAILNWCRRKGHCHVIED